MAEKYIIFSLEDEKARALGEAISNPACKKIVNFLADKEASASDISKELGMPLNNVDYSIKKLIGAGIVEKSKKFLWSVKGKRIENYRVVNKVIVISPRKTEVYSKLKELVPAVFVSAIFTGVLGWYFRALAVVQKSADVAAESLMAASAQAPLVSSYSPSYPLSPWIWFAFGWVVMLFILFMWSWKRD